MEGARSVKKEKTQINEGTDLYDVSKVNYHNIGKEIKKLEQRGGSLEPENIGIMRGSDNLDESRNPDNLYQSSSDSSKKKCFLGWCKQ